MQGLNHEAHALKFVNYRNKYCNDTVYITHA